MASTFRRGKLHGLSNEIIAGGVDVWNRAKSECKMFLSRFLSISRHTISSYVGGHYVKVFSNWLIG